MPNIATAMREEITRLSRRASRKDLDAMKKASAQHRRHIAADRRIAPTNVGQRMLAARAVHQDHCACALRVAEAVVTLGLLLVIGRRRSRRP